MREEVLKGHTRRVKTGCGNLYITINEEKGDPKEVFVRLGKAGGCAASQSEALGRLITLALRAGVEMKEIVMQLAGIGCHQPNGFGDTKVLSCADAVARCLGKGLKKKEEEVVPKPKSHSTPKAEILPLLTKTDDEVLLHEENIVWAEKKAHETPTFMMTPCPDCGAPIFMEEGCEKCHVCGYTKCG